jgi:hypothetical protein
MQSIIHGEQYVNATEVIDCHGHMIHFDLRRKAAVWISTCMRSVVVTILKLTHLWPNGMIGGMESTMYSLTFVSYKSSVKGSVDYSSVVK